MATATKPAAGVAPGARQRSTPAALPPTLPALPAAAAAAQGLVHYEQTVRE